MGAKSRGCWPGACLKDCFHHGSEMVCNSCIRFSNLNNEHPEVFVEKKSPSGLTSKSGKESMRFYPHYNNAFGKYISTKGEYLSEMKKGGYEPYTGEAKKPERQRPDGRPTAQVLRAIDDCSNRDGSFSPGANLKRALIDRGVIMSKDSLHAYHNKVKEMTRG
jgi:hypothetical protein